MARRASICRRRRCRREPSTATRIRSGGTRMARPSSNPTPSPTWPTARRSASADNDERYGAQGAFLIEAGISSSYHIASFFGLTEWIVSQSARKLQGSRQELQGKFQPSFKAAGEYRFRRRSRADAGYRGGAAAAGDIDRQPEPSARRAPRYRCRRRDHPRAHGRRPDEIRTAASVGRRRHRCCQREALTRCRAGSAILFRSLKKILNQMRARRLLGL